MGIVEPLIKCRWATSNQLKAQTEQKGRKRANLLSLSLSFPISISPSLFFPFSLSSPHFRIVFCSYLEHQNSKFSGF
jgi:hypothetical protein